MLTKGWNGCVTIKQNKLIFTARNIIRVSKRYLITGQFTKTSQSFPNVYAAKIEPQSTGNKLTEKTDEFHSYSWRFTNLPQ